MNIANLTPAERMKASALIGLILVVLFFAGYTLIGAVRPKAQPAPVVPGQAAAPAGTPVQTAQAPAGPVSPEEGFPTAKVAAEKRTADPEPDLQIPDPFRPNQMPAGNRPAPGSAANAGPRVEVLPNSQPLPPLGIGSALPGPGAAAGGPEPAPEVNPEIRVIGIVHAQPSVATLLVRGRPTLFRPGDAIATGWRLKSVDSDGVRIKHDSALISVRVGSAINEPEGKAQQ